MDIENSVTRLQEQVEVLQRERREDRESMQEIRQDVRTTREVVQRLEVSLTAIANQPRCAAPSTCMVLQPKVAEHETRLRTIESVVEQGKGGWKTLVGLASLGGGGIGAFISWLIHSKP